MDLAGDLAGDVKAIFYTIEALQQKKIGEVILPETSEQKKIVLM
jgi:hypothetical protein